MNKIFALLVFVCFISFTTNEKNSIIKQPALAKDSIPAFVLGDFMDDYGIRYNVTDSVWLQRPDIKYHIIKWNIKEQYIIARNDANNPGEKGMYSRIDFMTFENMEPFKWGFCLTVYNVKSDSLAEFTAQADRLNPRKGCNNYPFSRMKRN